MNFTVANHNDKYQSKGFIHYDSVEFENIPEMVTAGYAYASGRFKDNHRLNNNYEGYEDVLILDIDDGCSIEQAQSIFGRYKHFIITTKSHQKNKNGFVCDRFRVFLLLSETILHETIRENLIKSVFDKFSFIDASCKNSSRFYYSSPSDAIIIYNDGRTYPSYSINQTLSTVEDTETEKITHTMDSDFFIFNELTEQWENKYGDVLKGEGGGIDSKLKGAITILDDEFYSGQRNHVLFKVACMLLKDGLSEDDVANFIIKENDSRDGLKLSEVMACIKSAIRTI